MSRHLFFPIVWGLIVGLLCGMPGNSFPDLSFWKLLQFDSAAHAFVFAIFSFLWAVAFSKQVSSALLKKWAQPSSVLLGIAYGILLEILQYLIFYRRSAEWSDMVSDSIGCFAGWLAFYLVYRDVLPYKTRHQS